MFFSGCLFHAKTGTAFLQQLPPIVTNYQSTAAAAMARSSRSSAKKANNQRKAAGIFGPVEAARAERLSARLLEIANQPKPESSDVNMDG